MSSVNEALAGLQAVSAWQERVYKDFHAHPELSFQETKTAALAASKLGTRLHTSQGSGPPARRSSETAKVRRAPRWRHGPLAARKTPVRLAATLTRRTRLGNVQRRARLRT